MLLFLFNKSRKTKSHKDEDALVICLHSTCVHMSGCAQLNFHLVGSMLILQWPCNQIPNLLRVLILASSTWKPPTWNCCRFRERRKRLGENINASSEHMTMTPETLHHQLVKPQSKSKQRRILTAHTHSTRISREEFLLSCCKAQPCKPPRTESTWSGPKLQSLLGRNHTFSVSTHQPF